ncbi:MAG: hypothetical protein B0W54_19600 [Cellvibrio sp. 79]|nr:MAG: hypothetical protein B0W54_19600 [Cellvibrio sp. 79]
MKSSSLTKTSFLKKSLAIATLGMFSLPVFALSPPATQGWTVYDGKLLDPNGNPFIFRGVTIDHSRAPDKTVQALKDIAALGANSAQIEFPLNYTVPFLSPRAAVTELIQIIKTCAEVKLVCVLEPNDVAGFGATTNTASPSATIDLWQASDMKMALSAPGVNKHIIIGMGNQHFGSGDGLADFYKDTMQNYTSWLLSVLPPNFLVMIDGSEWGQDTSKAMHHVAQGINQDAALKRRVIYSVDFFSEYLDPNKVRDYIAGFAEIGAPLVVGGFGPMSYYHPFHPIPLQLDAPQLPAAAVMQYAQEYGAGYFGWSWSGNQNFALDVVSNWNSAALTPWGNLLFNDVNGIKSTAKIASIYHGSSSSSSSSSSSANRNPVAYIDGGVVQVRCGIVNAELTAVRSIDPDGDPLSYEWNVQGGYSGTSTYTGASLSYSMRPVTNYTFTLTVSDGKGGVGTASKVLYHSYSDNCISSSRTSTSSSIPSSVSTTSSRSSIPSSVSSTSRSSSSVAVTKANCSYVVNNQWSNGFTASIRIKNTSNTVINGWDVNWQYSDGSKVTNLWNANFSGANPYNAKNLNWNAAIQPGQTIEFGFQGSKPSGAVTVPIVTGAICQ